MGCDRSSGPTLPDGLGTGGAVDALDDLEHDAVVLAMPDPQAARLAPDAVEWVDYEPVITVVAGWARRCWPVSDAAFVNDDADVTTIADDGSRRGDGAAVLVVHTTARLAGAHLDAPDGAVTPVLTALQRIMNVTEEPEWTHAHRWMFAKPVATHGDDPFGLVTLGGRALGLCGDFVVPVRSATHRVRMAVGAPTRQRVGVTAGLLTTT